MQVGSGSLSLGCGAGGGVAGVGLCELGVLGFGSLCLGVAAYKH